MRGTNRRHRADHVGNTDQLQVSRPSGDQVQIVHEWPPRREEIEGVFGALPDGVVFAWGDKIMVPSGTRLQPWLIDHELVHLDQQEAFGGLEPWWDRYLIDPDWRLEQELEAHIEEYRSLCRYEKDRNTQARYLNEIGGRLASKMYGNLISRGDAMRRIRRGT